MNIITIIRVAHIYWRFIPCQYIGLSIYKDYINAYYISLKETLFPKCSSEQYGAYKVVTWGHSTNVDLNPVGSVAMPGFLSGLSSSVILWIPTGTEVHPQLFPYLNGCSSQVLSFHMWSREFCLPLLLSNYEMSCLSPVFVTVPSLFFWFDSPGLQRTENQNEHVKIVQ